MTAPRSLRGADGFSLPEATLALGLLAGVLISLSGMFLQADQMMRRGKQQTEALAVVRNIFEETEGWHFQGLYERFGYDGSAASYTVDSRSHAEAAGWQAELDRGLHAAHAEVRIESVVPSGSPPPLDSARAIRITVTVEWLDGQKPRRLRATTVRL